MIQPRNSPTLSLPLSMTALGFIFQAQSGQSNFPLWLILVIVLAIFLFVLFWLPRRQREEAAKEASQPLMAAAMPQASIAMAEPVAAISTAVMPELEEVAALIEPVESVEPDDLKIIEGIGPKIAGLLQAAGIMTFAQLAAADVSRLQEILEAAGLSRLADPTTWAEQAQLAAAGQWAELETLQDQLKGGRRVS